MEGIKNLIMKFITKEKILSYAIGALIALSAAGIGADSKVVKDLVCEIKQEK